MPLPTMDEKAIFNIARCIDVSEARAEYLKQVCGADPELFARVVALLEIHDQERTFLESPAVAENLAVDKASPERPGTQRSEERRVGKECA